MHVYVDIPRSILADADPRHDQHRLAFSQLVQVLLRGGYAFTVLEMRPFDHIARSAALTDGIYYAYHADNPGPDTYCFKQGSLPYLWHLDPGGYSGWCALARDPALQERSAAFPLDRAREVIGRYRRLMLEENLSIQPQPEGAPDLDLDALGDFVFYPLQTNVDDVMELGRIPQFALLRGLAALAAAHRHHVVVKRHPLCQSPTVAAVLEELAGNPFVHVSAGSVNTLIARSRCVLVTNSGVGLQALVHGRPVYSAGASEYAHMTVRLGAPEDLALLFGPQPPEPSERITRQLGYLLDDYLVDVRDPDRLARRVAEHAAGFRARPEAAAAPERDTFASLARYLQRQVRDHVDFLLAAYFVLPPSQREAAATALIRLAREGHHLERIVAGTDPAVSGRCMHYHIAKGQWDRAETLARVLAETGPPGASGVLQQLGEALFRRGDKAWLRHARAAAALPGAGAANHLFLAQRLFKTAGRPITELRRALARALALDPDNAQAHRLAVQVALCDGRTDLARKSLARARRLAPDDPVLRGLAARIRRADAPREDA